LTTQNVKENSNEDDVEVVADDEKVHRKARAAYQAFIPIPPWPGTESLCTA
jgi:hypothetical protein